MKNVQWNPIFLLQKLIRCQSITPQEGGALTFLQNYCQNMGFIISRPIFQEKGTQDVENFYARIGKTGPHLMFAGHTDVVPTGEEMKWKHPPFAGNIEDGILYGRGAVDMKGGIACFLAAVARFINRRPLKGSLSLLITGDEEGAAINGTIKLLQWAANRGEKWSAALIGEPTCSEKIGDIIKIGRRGSTSGILTVYGKQGHVAYPHLARNPLPVLVSLVKVLSEKKLDTSTKDFQASNLEFTGIDTGNNVTNIIPEKARACFNIRFNDNWSVESLHAHIEQYVSKILQNTQQYKNKNFLENSKIVHGSIFWQEPSAPAFVTHSKNILEPLSKAIFQIANVTPKLSTSGGTSDARFIKNYCPVAEFGLIGKTMHKINERVDIADLEQLTAIYQKFLEFFFDL